MEKNKRQARFNSFELSDCEEHQSGLKNSINDLVTFFPKTSKDWQRIDELVEASSKYIDEHDGLHRIPMYEETFVKTARSEIKCIEAFKNIRSIMNQTNLSDEIINWDLLIKDGFNVELYHVFIYTLMSLVDIDLKDKINRDLAFNAGRTYIFLLSLPGAKRCLVFESDLVIKYFKLFSCHEKLKSDSYKSRELSDCYQYLEIQIIQMLNECKTVFNIVCLSDQEEVLEKYIETMSYILETHMASSSQSAYEIIMKCYDNLDAVCLRPLADKDIEKTLYLILCKTVNLHYISPRRSTRQIKGKHGESISDFFLYLLSNYSEKTKNILLKFVKSLLSNLEHKFDKEKFHKLLDVAVKYELAIYWSFNESIVEYLQRLSLSSDYRHRINCVEFCQKMLLINSTPDPDQQSSNFEIPREAEILKILMEKVYDKQDNVKLKALTAMKAALSNGNDFTKKIFNVVFKKVSKDDNPEIMKVLGEEASRFQNNLLTLLQSSTATYIRKTCLEILAQHCDNFLESEFFIDTILSLTDDNSYLVKTQLIDVVNTLVQMHSTNGLILELWLDVILGLIRDNDNKIVEAATKSLTGIFQKIECFEHTVNEIQRLPWQILRLIMIKGKRNILQNAVNGLTTSFLTQDKLRKIETHIFTSNKTEAWCLLSIIAKKMKSNNPDIVVKTFLDSIDEQSMVSDDFHLILEVIQCWMPSFSEGSNIKIAEKLSHMLENGKCTLSVVSIIYELCIASRNIISGKDHNLSFIKRLNEKSQKYVNENFESFLNTSDEMFLAFLLLYCETNTDLQQRPDKKITDQLHDFIKGILSGKIVVSIQFDVPRKLNIAMIVLTRFAIRDDELASEITPDLAMLLRMNLVVNVIKTAMQCLNDLCKKHTSTVDPVFKEIVFKLHSTSEEIRLCALENIYDLVMQDFIKMKGRVLINLLACLVDKNESVQLKSQAAILSYTNDKNRNLLYSSFLESVYIFNDFIQWESFGVFPLDEIDRNYKLLYGDSNKQQRQELYQFFVQTIHDLNEVHLLMLLKQITVLKEKFEKKNIQKSLNGVNAFRDLIYIFKLICDKRGESKLKINKSEGEDCNMDDPNDDVNLVESTKSQQKGRGKHKHTLTVNDALPIVEKMVSIFPQFARFVIDYDQSLKSEIDELTKSIAKNFSTLIEFNTNKFWKQDVARKINDKRRSGTSKKRKNPIDSSSSDDD